MWEVEESLSILGSQVQGITRTRWMAFEEQQETTYCVPALFWGTPWPSPRGDVCAEICLHVAVGTSVGQIVPML